MNDERLNFMGIPVFSLLFFYSSLPTHLLPPTTTPRVIRGALPAEETILQRGGLGRVGT